VVAKASGFVLLDVIIGLGVLGILLAIGGQCLLELKRMNQELQAIETNAFKSMNEAQRALYLNQQLPTGNITLCQYHLGAFESVYVCKK